MAGPTTTSAGTPAFEDSQGWTVTIGGTVYKCTDVSKKRGGDSAASGSQQLDVSTIDIPSGSDKVYQSPPLNEVTSSGGTGVLATYSFEYIGRTEPQLNTNLRVTIAHATHGTWEDGTGRVTDNEIKLKVNDTIRGSMTVELVSKTPPAP